MVEEPDNLVLKMLREMRSALDENGRMLREHSEQFALLNKKIDDWQETTATGVGFATHAAVRTQNLAAEIADLKEPVARLENSENRH